MEALTWIVIGLIAVWIAARIIHSALGLLRILIVGLFGAILGTLLFTRLGIHAVPDFWGALIAAAVVVVVLLWIWRAIRRA
jgi:uncharacterized membrane protein YeaQ/YmgE (transglycosylase-associated protein family)